MTTKTQTLITLIPSEGMRIKHNDSGQIYEGTVFLGCEDDSNKYVEVTEAEYQEYLSSQNEEGDINE